MATEPKLNASVNADVLEKLRVLPKFSEKHDEAWRNAVANDLNLLSAHALFMVGNFGGVITANYTAALMRIIERVAHFEEIQMVDRKTK